MSPAASNEGLVWADDLSVYVVYRALVMQLYFQASLLLIYGFGSTLPAGELSAALFGSKIQTAGYETLAVTAGVLVYPRIAHLLQTRDHAAVEATMMQALSWLLPATAALVVLLITCRQEIVALVYERHAFDERAAQLVAAGLLGYAPGIIGLTLVEIFHRTMVLRGRLTGYAVVFSGALILNWLCYRFFVPILGVLGLTISSSVGVLAAGTGLVVYASRRLESMDTKRMLLLVVRTAAAAGVALVVLTGLHANGVIRPSHIAEIVTVAENGVAAATILTLALLALGHRWRVPMQLKG
jgi:putative peptidoglycan lipid II flippase